MQNGKQIFGIFIAIMKICVLKNGAVKIKIFTPDDSYKRIQYYIENQKKLHSEKTNLVFSWTNDLGRSM